MNWYRVQLNGKNFLLNLQDNPRKYGFYTTKDVEAESFEEAELKAVKLVRDDETLRISSLNEKDDSPMIYVEEMRILDQDEERLSNSGHSFYIEDDETS